MGVDLKPYYVPTRVIDITHGVLVDLVPDAIRHQVLPDPCRAQFRHFTLLAVPSTLRPGTV